MILFVAFIAVTFIARLFYLQVLSPNYQERAKRKLSIRLEGLYLTVMATCLLLISQLMT